jgi:hypothetical protein
VWLLEETGVNKDIVLSSGAKLHITLSPFATSKTLYQAVLEEIKELKLDANAEVDVNLFKDFFCAGFSSKRIEAALNECMKRVTYNGVKITEDTFEPVDAREDYMTVCLEVALHNILPFTKNLTQQYSRMLDLVPKNPVSK